MARYRTIVERILRARLVYIKPYMNRAISFEYMNRQLVWHEFSVPFCHVLAHCWHAVLWLHFESHPFASSVLAGVVITCIASTQSDVDEEARISVPEWAAHCFQPP